MDDAGSLYVADYEKNEVLRYRRGKVQGTVVAGGNGNGKRLNQLDSPSYLFVNREHSVFISDTNNRRVMKWASGAKEGMIVAAGQGQGGVLSQVLNPAGVLVDQLVSLYVLLYVGLRNPQAQVITIAPITLNIFDELYLEYNETLSCPCSTTMVPYKNFVSQKFTFHPVCSSIFVSQQWIEALYLFNASKYVPFDFRTTASSQYIHYDETCH
ncbi:unnamed protein product [Adineta steineri]|uniref:Uncharacterized protein n=1 Tax=Adineta steineri TaxID=433720 RepID=A0A819RCL5_9BILA|nr:unnamed protein product [Adineta steineri]